jgi:hypothetical protein
MSGLVKFAAGAAVALVLSAGAAQASTWVITYQADNAGDSPLSATLDLVASDTLNAVGGYDVTAISGDVDGDTITGLIANPGQPYASLSPDGLFSFDNVIWPNGAPQLSNPGLLFTGASSDEYNLFSVGPTTYQLYKAAPFSGYLATSTGSISIAPTLGDNLGQFSGGVPEPSSWVMMILGFGGIGALLRQRRGRLAAA